MASNLINVSVPKPGTIPVVDIPKVVEPVVPVTRSSLVRRKKKPGMSRSRPSSGIRKSLVTGSLVIPGASFLRRGF